MTASEPREKMSDGKEVVRGGGGGRVEGEGDRERDGEECLWRWGKKRRRQSERERELCERGILNQNDVSTTPSRLSLNNLSLLNTRINPDIAEWMGQNHNRNRTQTEFVVVGLDGEDIVCGDVIVHDPMRMECC